MDETENKPKLNLGQLSAITFITSVFAELSDKETIDEQSFTEILAIKANTYLVHIPYGKAKELIRLAIEHKNIIQTI